MGDLDQQLCAAIMKGDRHFFAPTKKAAERIGKNISPNYVQVFDKDSYMTIICDHQICASHVVFAIYQTSVFSFTSLKNVCRLQLGRLCLAAPLIGPLFEKRLNDEGRDLAAGPAI